MPRIALLVALLLALAGCAGLPGPPTDSSSSPAGSATAAPVPSASASVSPTPRTSTPVAYAIRAGGPALSEFRSVNVTVATIAFQDGAPHQCHGDLVAGEVTKTPTPTPEVDLGLDCVVFARNVTIDLTAATAATAIGQYTVPSIVSGDTYLVVRRLNGTLENGSRVTFGDDDFQATGTGHRVNGRTLYGVEFDVVKGNYCKGYCIDYGGFHPDASLDPATHYTFAVDGRIRNGEMVTLTVSRNGTPMAAVLHVEGAAEERYDTGSDGRIKVEVTGAEVFEVEIEHVEAT